MESIKVELAKNVSQIMAEFDFETCVKILEMMDIKWVRDGEERHPTIDDVRETANELIWNSIEYASEHESDSAYSESGCFRAEYRCDDKTKEEWIDLIFEPCSWRKID
jgi:hypothetical protein